MDAIRHEVDRCLVLIRNKIRDRAFTQLEVQKNLGWGRSYISQLLTHQKHLRFDQVLKILETIGVEPSAFFAELYGASSSDATPRSVPGQSLGTRDLERRQQIGELRTLLRALVFTLVEDQVISEEDLMSAVQTARGFGARGAGSEPDLE